MPRRRPEGTPRRREVGMVFQSYAIWPHMTVFRNVAYPLQHRRMSRSAIAKRVSEVLELVGLEDYAERPVVALSGGQMQRVALARSLAYHPRILLLDEPLSNLDAKLRLRLRVDLRKIIKEAGVTALYVTHDQGEAVALGDRVAVMQGGKLLQIAQPVELYNAPAELFVAEFTGATNIVPCRILARSGKEARVGLTSGAEMVAQVHPGAQDGDLADLAVRPENITLVSSSERRDDYNAITGHVLEALYQGIQTSYQVKAGSDSWEAVEFGTAPRHAKGEAVFLSVPTASCWAFPRRHGNALAGVGTVSPADQPAGSAQRFETV
ncbi:ABC transporter ATP-binding protein [Aurantimonas sp. C2-6-R+9]|uniref:ABC transporter ATP-binding protein n=1 Tax=unclassified Aurantimonas TaxID=2638230 RepID=UPI002E19785C|nr:MULTISPECIES: ABC transporter ATP-binding protein [unclassified Aurantimonas]MEC5292961.1 ABC transporter ATP-binding protein [Aurantimonas sp. C2-3-R2]MEC5383230.1 ABC transporter ATP-binding protein [Aurantimonas sp. C2-6-R+9]MEC5413986.1 ABC transporter ATP-binding protein [Aurantimonas sp. C2-4-R8]